MRTQLPGTIDPGTNKAITLQSENTMKNTNFCAGEQWWRGMIGKTVVNNGAGYPGVVIPEIIEKYRKGSFGNRAGGNIFVGIV